jgi:uncharacterized protein YjiS (DUF1127 family)
MHSSRIFPGGRTPGRSAQVVAENLAAWIAECWAPIARWVRALERARRNAIARRELSRLTDHFLRDVGLERSDIDRLFR